MRLNFILFFSLLASFLIAQKPLTIEGQILDEQDEVIPFVTISSQKTYAATTSDKNGNFKLVLSEKDTPDTLLVRHISFENKQFHLTKTTLNDLIKITMQTKNNEIGTTKIYAYGAKNYVEKAIENLDNNYHNNKYYLEGFYRQKHKENGKYVRLIEAIASIEENTYNRSSEKQKERFNIQWLRRSNVYERNGDKHGDHFVDLMSENPINYSQVSFLNNNNIHNYNFRFLKSDKSSEVKIYFQNKTWEAAQNKSGYLIINKEDFAVLSIEIISTKNTSYLISAVSNWKFQNGTYQAKYIKGKQKYHCIESSKYYNHYVLNDQSKNIDFVVEEYFEWFTFDLFKEKTSNKKYSLLSNLYSKDYTYDSKYWNNILLPKIEQKVYNDLNSFKDLEKQFLDD